MVCVYKIVTKPQCKFVQHDITVWRDHLSLRWYQLNGIIASTNTNVQQQILSAHSELHLAALCFVTLYFYPFFSSTECSIMIQLTLLYFPTTHLYTSQHVISRPININSIYDCVVCSEILEWLFNCMSYLMELLSHCMLLC